MSGLFVTGTGTNVGKTWVSAWLTRSWRAAYWKPVQSGTLEGWDADVVRRVAPEAVILDSRHALPAPLSPDQAAARVGVRIALEDFTLPPHDRDLLLVEGAGGVLVPLNDRHLMVDLMVRLGLPVLLVASSQLGTINHSLLSVAALQRAGLTVVGVVLNGPPEPENRAAIEHFGRVAVVAELPPLADLAALAAYPAPDWRPF